MLKKWINPNDQIKKYEIIAHGFIHGKMESIRMIEDMYKIVAHGFIQGKWNQFE